MEGKSCKNCEHSTLNGAPETLDHDCGACCRLSNFKPVDRQWPGLGYADLADAPDDYHIKSCSDCVHFKTKVNTFPCSECWNLSQRGGDYFKAVDDDCDLDCFNCKHGNSSMAEEPCCSCLEDDADSYPNWEPEDEDAQENVNWSSGQDDVPNGDTCPVNNPYSIPAQKLADAIDAHVMGEIQSHLSSNPGMTGQYTFRGGIEPLEFIESNGMSFLEGNVIKYLYRYPNKGGLEALKKAAFYLNRIIEAYEEG